IGEYWYRQGDPSKAQTFLNLAIQHTQKYDSPSCVGFQASLALIEAEEGKAERALERLDEGEKILQKHPREHAVFLLQKTRILLLINRVSHAIRSLQRVNQIAERLGIPIVSRIGRMLVDTRALVRAARDDEKSKTAD
ncbi:MAG: hypothetical protein VX278_00910, partial [Myxococcota bacterium]|nr:hypothetical protein [Myxococcota bacterium]